MKANAARLQRETSVDEKTKRKEHKEWRTKTEQIKSSATGKKTRVRIRSRSPSSWNRLCFKQQPQKMNIEWNDQTVSPATTGLFPQSWRPDGSRGVSLLISCYTNVPLDAAQESTKSEHYRTFVLVTQMSYTWNIWNSYTLNWTCCGCSGLKTIGTFKIPEPRFNHRPTGFLQFKLVSKFVSAKTSRSSPSNIVCSPL